MSDALFPALAGLAWGVVKRPAWKTVVHESANGAEARLAYYALPRWRWTLTYEFLRQGDAAQEFEQLVGFFNARRGRFDSFLYEDPSDREVAAHLFAIGDGVRTAFPLSRTLGGFTEPVPALTAVAGVQVNGAPSPDYGVNVDTRAIVFPAAPAAGAVLTWSGTYRWRVRFDQDTADFSAFARAFWELRQITLLSVR